jgi:hypothetical protein
MLFGRGLLAARIWFSILVFGTTFAAFAAFAALANVDWAGRPGYVIGFLLAFAPLIIAEVLTLGYLFFSRRVRLTFRRRRQEAS